MKQRIARNLPSASVLNTKTGQYLLPNSAQVSSSTLPALPLPTQSWVNVSLININQTDLYPIAGLSYMLIYQNQSGSGIVGAALKEFLQWTMSPYMQRQIPAVAFAPLSDDVVAHNLDAINSIIVDPAYSSTTFVSLIFFDCICLS